MATVFWVLRVSVPAWILLWFGDVRNVCCGRWKRDESEKFKVIWSFRVLDGFLFDVFFLVLKCCFLCTYKYNFVVML